MAGDLGVVGIFLGDYLQALPSEIMSGDVFAVTLVLIVGYFVVLFINKLTGLLVYSLKKLFLLAIVSIAFYKFAQVFFERLLAEGTTYDTLAFGLAGLTAGSVAMIIALYAAFHSVKNIKTVREEQADEPRKDEGKAAAQEKPAEDVHLLSIQSLKDDKTLGAVLTYLVIAEFGVFSSKTIAAPTAGVGLGFFIVFMIAAVLFVYRSYHDHRRGIRHLSAALLVGALLSIILGHFWGNYPLTHLLSPEYFSTESLVALVTGLSISLFMGSKS